MIFIEYIKQAERTAFAAKLNSIAASLGIDPDHLMAVFYKESRVNPQAVNKKGGATGLIQFMPDTAAWLGTSTTALYQMTATAQLDYVYKYFSKLGAAGKLHDFTDVYMAVFFPAALGKPEDWVLHTSTLTAQRIALSNPGIDLNKDQVITVAEFRRYATLKMPQIVVAALFKKKSEGMIILAAAFLSYITYKIVKRHGKNKKNEGK